MSVIRNFIERVVPWPIAGAPGFINLHWRANDAEKNKSFWGGRAFTEPTDLLQMAAWGMERPAIITDLYFCLSRQAECGKIIHQHAVAKRMAKNAVALKAIWLDVDVKEEPKGYPDIYSALDAITKFAEQADLPPPTALVASGGGVHVYWISSHPLTLDEWTPYAAGLKAAAIKYGLRCDAGVTTDAARILRLPGTANFKTDPPKPVKLLGLRPDDYDFDTALSKLATTVTAVVPDNAPFDLSKFPKREPLAGGVESLSDGLEREELPPLNAEPVLRGCPFYMDALLTGGKDHSQGLWNLAILGTTFLDKGEKVAHAIGDKHPGYTPDSTKAMFNRKMRERTQNGLGWPRCVTIQAEGCKLCTTCPHFGKIKSPLNLALDATKAVAPAAPPFDLKETKNLSLPAKYVVNADGYICEVEEKLLKNGETQERILQLFNCKLSYPWSQKDPDVLHFTATTDKDNLKDIHLLTIKLATTTDVVRELLDQSVKPYFQNETRIRIFLMAWITELHKAQEATQSLPFGWWTDPVDKKHHGFVFGEKMIKDDGTEQPAGSADKMLAAFYRPTGSIEPWYDAMRSITAQHRPELEVIVAAAFAAPLMWSTGEYSSAFLAWGDTAGFKSTAQKVGLAVWGHPKLTKENIKSTSKSIVNKMGMLQNIPIFWDEITNEHVQKEVFNTVFGSEGVEGSRLNPNITQRNRGQWQTTLVGCSNMSLIDYIMTKQKQTAAGVYRIFEFDVPPAPADGLGKMRMYDASRLMQQLENNFGHMGMKYARMLGDNPAEIDAFAYNVIQEFDKKIGAQDGERYWIASCGTVLAGAMLANNLGCNFNVNEIEAFLLVAYRKLRDRVSLADLSGGSMNNTSDILTGWVRHATDGAVWTETCFMGRGRPSTVTVLYGPRPDLNRRIMVQWCVKDRVLLFSRQEFAAYLAQSGYQQHGVVEGLKRHFGASEPRAKLCAGTTYRLPQERLIRIPIPEGSPLEDMLYTHTSLERMNEQNADAAKPAAVAQDA